MRSADLPCELPPVYWTATPLGPDLGRVTWDGYALDVCFVCGWALSEDGGDYVNWVLMEAGDENPAPDPGYVCMCEDCESWWYMGWDEYDEEDW